MDPETIAAIRITKDNFRLLNRMLTQIERILEINVLDPKNGSSSPSTAAGPNATVNLFSMCESPSARILSHPQVVEDEARPER